MEPKNLYDLIASKDLTAAELEVAEFFLQCTENPRCYSTRKLAEKVYVSDMTVLRFVRKLGYVNLIQFYDAWFPVQEKREEWEASVAAIREETAKQFQSDLLFQIACKTAENLHKGLSGISSETLEEIVKLLMESECRYVAGFQLNACCAAYLARKMRCYLKHVEDFVLEDAGQIERMIDMGPADCLVLFAFAPYTRMNEPLLQIAKERGTKIVVLTDRVTSPASAYADVCLVVPVKGVGDVKSYAVPMGVAEAILLMLGMRLEDLHAHEVEKAPLLEYYLEMYDKGGN